MAITIFFKPNVMLFAVFAFNFYFVKPTQFNIAKIRKGANLLEPSKLVDKSISQLKEN